MAHHLTPAELADQMQMERQEVIGKCVRDGGPDLPRPDRQDAVRNLAAQHSASRPPDQASRRLGAELDSPGRCRGEVRTRRRSPICCRRQRSYTAPTSPSATRRATPGSRKTFNEVAGDRPPARLRPRRPSESRRATASRSSATPGPSGPTSTSPRSRSAPPSSRSTRPTRPRSAATSSRTPTPRWSSSRTPNSWRRCARFATSCRSSSTIVLMTGSAEDAISMEDLAAKGAGGDAATWEPLYERGHPRRHLHLHLHLGHHRAAEGLHHQPRQLPGDARHGQRRQRHRGRGPHLPLPAARPLLRAADPARQLRPRRHPRLLGARPAEDPPQPGRGEADLLPLGAADLREDLHRRDQRDGERGRPQEADLQLGDRRRREDARGRTRAAASPASCCSASTSSPTSRCSRKSAASSAAASASPSPAPPRSTRRSCASSTPPASSCSRAGG